MRVKERERERKEWDGERQGRTALKNLHLFATSNFKECEVLKFCLLEADPRLIMVADDAKRNTLKANYLKKCFGSTSIYKKSGHKN